VRNIAAIALFIGLAAVVSAQQSEHADKQYNAPPNEAPLIIRVNPEARVSVALAGAFPQPVSCGAATDLAVRILNQSFATFRLEAQFVGEVPAGVSLDFRPTPLKGVREEFRNLRITLTNPGPTDLTVAFKAHNTPPDLGGRDRVHFVMRCIRAR
jgi:hypothetical protein